MDPVSSASLTFVSSRVPSFCCFYFSFAAVLDVDFLALTYSNTSTPKGAKTKDLIEFRRRLLLAEVWIVSAQRELA